jgi:hypothetical protein
MYPDSRREGERAVVFLRGSFGSQSAHVTSHNCTAPAGQYCGQWPEGWPTATTISAVGRCYVNPPGATGIRVSRVIQAGPPLGYSSQNSLYIKGPLYVYEVGLHELKISQNDGGNKVQNSPCIRHIKKFKLYRVSQEEISIFWEVIDSVILSKKCTRIYTCVLFRTVYEIELFDGARYRRATRRVLTRAAKCIDVDGGIFENVLY